MDLTLFERMFPAWALSREKTRHQLRVSKRLYNAAKSTLQRRPITSGALSADAVVDHGGVSLREQARFLDENHDLAIGVLDVLVDNTLGQGLQYEPMVRRRNGELADAVNEEIRDRWQEFWQRPEITGELPGAMVERLMCRTWLRDGEVFVRHIDGFEGMYKFALYEPDFVPFDLFQPNDNVHHGIEKDAAGRPVGYHFFKGHPGSLGGVNISSLYETTVIPARDISHLKFVRRLGQTRGVSVLHGVIARLDNIREADEAEQIAAKVAASFCAVIRRDADFAGADLDHLTTEGDRTFSMKSGMIFDNLLPGETVETIGTERPNTKLIDFLNHNLRAVASGTGASYSSISKDYSGNYSSQRQEMVENQVHLHKFRGYFIETGPRVIYERWLRFMLGTGAIRVPTRANGDTIFAVDIRPGGGTPWIDPLKEVQADIAQIDSGLASRHQIIRKRGGDPEQVDAEREQDTAQQQQEPLPTADNEPGDEPDNSEAAANG